MKVTTWVEFSQEVTVDIGREELLAMFTEAPDPNESWFVVLNRFAMALNALPDTTIATWNAKQRQAVYEFFKKHTPRFQAPTPFTVIALPGEEQA